ncbi:adenylyltransferase/cytidyltransferase family protein [Citrobacter sp. Res13-Sevr-PEB04-36]|uniref:adenylyltransferase/cytidyltransferase family protein n=1 Tax=Citrobacter sp. Res13-Sevr-PEB04-36 TaxID=2777960 RepID=UPI0018ACFA6F|nr:adenylyltransferase/cytidyltransferase family protein [Citrobacter sp. Res13-Sevr-PEB04-36]
MRIVITFGTFDVFHIGHLNILEQASRLGDRLIVGVSTDELNVYKKNRNPIYGQSDRFRIIHGLKCVYDVFYEESLDRKLEYINRYHADVLVMGDDWQGKFDSFSCACDVVYLPRTPSISTASIIEVAKGM